MDPHPRCLSISLSDTSTDDDTDQEELDREECILLLIHDLNRIAMITNPVLLSTVDGALEAAHGSLSSKLALMNYTL